MQTEEVCTDSKYVKEGITKWINKWKVNKWKTVKDKTDVLNKILWLTQDSLASKLNVKWQWIEGHGHCEGNIQSDALAKVGISSECCFWQSNLVSVETSSAIICQSRRSSYCSRNFTVTSSKSSQNGEIQSSDSKCGVCFQQVSESGIQCVDCRIWYHYRCSQLPAYQLFMFENSQRRYSCENCSQMVDNLLQKFISEASLHLLASPVPVLQSCNTDPEIKFKMAQTDAETQCNIQVEDLPVQTADNLLTRNVKDSSQQVQPVQVHREVQATEGFGMFADCFSEFKEGIIAKQEKSFVDALDNFSKVHSNISDLQAQIQKLTQEKEYLLKQKQKNKEPATQKVPECNVRNWSPR